MEDVLFQNIIFHPNLFPNDNFKADPVLATLALRSNIIGDLDGTKNTFLELASCNARFYIGLRWCKLAIFRLFLGKENTALRIFNNPICCRFATTSRQLGWNKNQVLGQNNKTTVTYKKDEFNF